MSSDKKSGGGSATNAGVEYQAGVAAWLAALVLAGEGATPPFGLPETEKTIGVRLESAEPVDDISAETSAQRRIFIQAKRSVSLSTDAGSDFGKTMKQFTEQYIQRKGNGVFDGQKDLYVLAVGDTTPLQVSETAAGVLNKLRAGTNPQTFNTKEQNAYKTIADHIKRVWLENKGNEIDDTSLGEIIKATRIQKVNVIDGGNEAERAKDLLRSQGLDDPSQAGAAWSILTAECVSLGRQRGGITHSSIEELLRSKAIALKSPLEFHKDIAQLQKYTERTLQSLSRAAAINLFGKQVKVQRSIVDELYKLANDGRSFIVVGEPGAGKSGALYETLERLKKDGHDIVAIATEKIEATSTGSLRNELGLKDELCNVLDNWKGAARGVLVIDALDAARDPHAAKLFLELAQSVINLPSDRWSVIISIRKYDLRYNGDIKQIFPQQQITQFIDPEFSISHVNVPLFDDIEMGQLKQQSPELKSLVEKAGKRMGQLLRSPFNLSIAAEIMGQGVNAQDLTQIQSQLELLDRYWGIRVTDNEDKKGNARGTLLATALNIMSEQQSLKVGRQELADKQPGLSEQLEQLLSRNVLVEDKATNRIGFYHHILYDYGVYKAVLMAGTGRFAELLENNPYLALSIRPSIQMYWQNAWQQDPSRKAYWSEVLALEADPDFPKLAKVFGADFAVAAVSSEDDLQPLQSTLMGQDQLLSQQAQAVVRRCSIAMDAAKKRKQDDGARHWVVLVDQALTRFTDYPLRPKLCSILESAVDGVSLTPEQHKAAGRAARRLLEIELEQEPPNEWIARVSVKLVALTYDSDPQASNHVLGRLLEDDMIAKYGYIYLRHLADNAGELADKNPALVEALYDKAFAYEEKGDEITSISNSQILGMTSNRKQDYGMVHHQLGWSFAKVIEKDLPLGLRLLNGVLAKSVADKDWRLSKPPKEAEFDFSGVKAKIVEDASYFWHDELTVGNDGSEVLNSFRKFIDDLAKQADGAERLVTALKAVANTNHAAVFWRVLLQAAETHSNTLGRALTPLLTALPILAFDDTAHQVSKFMNKIYPQLSSDERRNIENQIMLIPGMSKDQKDKKYLESTRDSFILELDKRFLETDAAKQRRTELDGQESAKGFSGHSLPRGGWIDDDELDEITGRKTHPHTKALKALNQKAQGPLGSLTSRNLTVTDATQMLELIEELKNALRENAEADSGWQDVIRDQIIRASSLLACSALFTPASPEWPQLRKDIMQGAGLVAPSFDKEADDAFAKDGIVYGSAPRASAAQALMALAAKETDVNQINIICDLIREMAKDEMGAVRAATAGEVHLLWHKDDPSFTWEIIDHFVKHETNPQVIEALLHSIGYLRGVDPARVTMVTVELYSACKSNPNKSLRQAAAINLALLYVDRDDQGAKEASKEIIKNPVERSDELERMIVHLRERLVHGIDGPSDAKAQALRARARWLLSETLSQLATGTASWKEEHDGKRFSDLADKDKEAIKAYYTNIENVATQIYFASGSFDEKQSKGGLAALAKAHFIQEQNDLIKQITATGDVRSAYHFVEMALAYQDIDPVWSLKLVETAVRSSVASGSANESLMATSIEMFVKQFIAKHRQYLQDKQNQRLLMSILDEFVDVGWPEAVNLTQDLEEIFR